MTLRMRVLPRFPATIYATNGIKVSRSAGSPNLTIEPDFASLVQIPSIDDGNSVFFTAFDSALDLYRKISFNDLFEGISGLGFMDESVYDPQGKHADAFARANHTGTQSISTVTGLQTALDGKIPLADGVRYDAAQTNTAARQGQARANISAALRGQLFGLTLSNNASDATNDIDIAVGEAASTEIDPALMVLATALTKRLDAAWAVGSGNGGLDTGSIANTTYHVWLIQRSDTGVVDALFSASATAPTMPTNYDRKRRIGSIIRISGAIKAFVQDGDDFQWVTPIQDVSATNPGASAVTRSTSLPSGIRVKGKFYVGFTASAAGDNPGAIALTDLSTADIAPSAAQSSLEVFGTAAGTYAGGATTEVYTNTSAQIRSRLQLSGANTILSISTAGWRDNRGRI